MPANRLSVRKTKEILRLRWDLGLSIRKIAASCGVGYATVHDTLARAKQAGLSWPLPEDLDEAALEARLYPVVKGRQRRAQPDFPKAYRALKRRGVTLELLWQEYREAHPEDGYAYSRFCELYRQWRGGLDLVMRQEHRAGEKLFVDYAGVGIKIVDPTTGSVTEAPVFVAALGASNFTYAEACEGQDSRSWIQAHIHTYEYIGGVSAVTVPDYVARHIIWDHPSTDPAEELPSILEPLDEVGETLRRSDMDVLVAAMDQRHDQGIDNTAAPGCRLGDEAQTAEIYFGEFAWSDVGNPHGQPAGLVEFTVLDGEAMQRTVGHVDAPSGEQLMHLD